VSSHTVLVSSSRQTASDRCSTRPSTAAPSADAAVGTPVPAAGSSNRGGAWLTASAALLPVSGTKTGTVTST